MSDNHDQKSPELIKIYEKQKNNFLDSLQPDDFRNGGSFNQAEIIIDELNKAFYRASIDKKEDAQNFIRKALSHLFRDNSAAIEKAIKLSDTYLKMRGVL